MRSEQSKTKVYMIEGVIWRVKACLEKKGRGRRRSSIFVALWFKGSRGSFDDTAVCLFFSREEKDQPFFFIFALQTWTCNLLF